MKTAVSIPDDVFEQAEAMARRAKQSRSEVYARALNEYIARHAPDRVTEAMDRALDEIAEPRDKFRARAARQTLNRAEW
jgi:metal-responsive CopG/Arc/MetJ family transcriptional regulator